MLCSTHSDCGCGPAYKTVTLDADPQHKSDRPESCVVRYHGNYCYQNAFELEVHWIAATGCIVNDMVRREGVKESSKSCKHLVRLIHSDEGLKLETSVSESFTVANLPYRPCG